MKEINIWTQKIKEAPGEKIIAILGAGHVPGINRKSAMNTTW